MNFKKQRTLIEYTIAAIFVGVVGMVCLQVYFSIRGNSEYSIGLSGVTETRCISGTKVLLVPSNGVMIPQQLLDVDGKPMKC